MSTTFIKIAKCQFSVYNLKHHELYLYDLEFTHK